MTAPFKINPDNLTLGEVETIEELTGTPLSQLIGNGGVTAKTASALVYVLRRRDNPAFTLEDARSMPLSAIEFVGSGVDPTQAAG